MHFRHIIRLSTRISERRRCISSIPYPDSIPVVRSHDGNCAASLCQPLSRTGPAQPSQSMASHGTGWLAQRDETQIPVSRYLLTQNNFFVYFANFDSRLLSRGVKCVDPCYGIYAKNADRSTLMHLRIPKVWRHKCLSSQQRRGCWVCKFRYINTFRVRPEGGR